MRNMIEWIVENILQLSKSSLTATSRVTIYQDDCRHLKKKTEGD